MRLKSALRRGVAAAVIAGIVVSSGIPAYAKTWDIANGDITVKGASDESGNYNEVKQGNKDFEKDTDTVITSKSDKSEESKEHTVTIDTSGGNVDVTFDNLKIDVSGKGEAAVTVKGGGDATIELDGDNELKSGSYNAGLEKNDERSENGKTISGKLTIKDDKGKDGSLTAEGGEGGGAGIGGKLRKRCRKHRDHRWHGKGRGRRGCCRYRRRCVRHGPRHRNFRRQGVGHGRQLQRP